MHGVSIIHLDFFRWADAKAKELLLFRTIQVVGCSFMANGHNYPGRGIPPEKPTAYSFLFLANKRSVLVGYNFFARLLEKI